MGITGLIPYVKRASREVSVSELSNLTVAVDAYCWLHKGAFSCAEKLVKGEQTNGYVHYCMKMVNMLLGNGLRPILVFDGQNLPAKKQTEVKRRENREKNRTKAKEFLREGRLKEARECFQRCVDVTPQMAREVILACRSKGVDCIVAPYEADAQLAYLCKVGIAQVVITEDSDLILFGCEKVLFKMDSGGHGILVEQSQLHLCMGLRAESFTFDKFRHTCILSGCDYLDSLPGIGLAKAAKFFSLSSNPNLSIALSRIPSYLRMPRLTVSGEYKEGFIKAENTFLYQLVFCPLQKKLVPLNPYPSGMDPAQMEYAGRYLPRDLAQELAKGNINVSTLERFPENDNTPKYTKVKQQRWSDTSKPVSIWSSDFQVKKPKVPETQNSTPISTTGKVTQVVVPKSLLVTHKKRKLESEDPFFNGPSDQDLLSQYAMENSPPTEPKHESPTKANITSDGYVSLSALSERKLSPLLEGNRHQMSASEEGSPLKSTPVRNRFCVRKSAPVTAAPIIRSRFFWNSSEKITQCQPLLDQTNEDQSRPENIIKIMKNCGTLTSSPKVKAAFKPVIFLKSFKSENEENEIEVDSCDLLTSSQNPTFGSSQSSLVTDEDNSQKCGNCWVDSQNDMSPCSQSSDLEEPLTQSSENLSQLTVCSIDKESFGLSQLSQDSEKGTDIIPQVFKKLKGPVSCRRVGLSKKTVPTILPGQLSLKDAFQKFRYTKEKSNTFC